jgi:hypothetical protein
VAGGQSGQANGASAFVGAGFYNAASAAGSVVAGGGSLCTGAPCNANGAQDAFIGSGAKNVINAGATTGAIVGGESNTIGAAATYSIVGGGYSNSVTGAYAVIGGGTTNSVAGEYASVLGGDANTAPGGYAAVAGGAGNSASGSYATVDGGRANSAKGYASTVTGGILNTAGGNYSFAGGVSSTITAAGAGTFMWSDAATAATPIVTKTGNQFLVRASGGTFIYSNPKLTTGVKLAAGGGSWASVSDRAVKDHIVAVDDATILAKVAALPISEWSYISEAPSIRHVGPMAQDFYAAFGIGEDDRHITTIDEDGVALAAIKGLSSEVRHEEQRNAALETANRALAADTQSLHRELDELRAEVAAMKKN